ncbi:MAG: tripartite tricarboxylate transporter TctB family protein [Deltaproteobacteria bacterium]|nr:tripartite tricarboxylate transporter TctB family protein [Deltaproteobacteria bacterium]
MGKKAEVWAAVLSLIWGLSYLLAAMQYPGGELGSPGPGLMPCLLGLVFMGLSAYLLVTNLRSKRIGSADQGPQSLRLGPLWQLIAILTAYLVAILPLGFAFSTFLAILFMSRLMGLEGWVKPTVLSLITVILAHLLFVLALDVPLPLGAIWEKVKG